MASSPSRAASAALWRRACAVIPGGVNSPVRAFGGVGGTPIFVRSAAGGHLTDVDGHRYLDVVGSFGPLIAGHAHPHVVAALATAAAEGTSFGASHAREVALAERVAELVPSVQSLRMVSSGTEATMSAVRLARGATGRDTIIKFAGCYHGHADIFLSGDAGSGLATLGIPASAGVPAAAVADVATLPYNDIAAVEEKMAAIGGRVAAIIVEPVACNMGLVLPREGFLAALRALCDRHGSLLIFDEVITGFRVALGGAQARLGMRPDLTTFGKILGGGLPVGAYGGRRDIMQHVSPAGPVYQAGTLSGNPLAMAAGMAMLDLLMAEDFYPRLEARAAALQAGIEDVLARHGHPARLGRLGSIFYLWFRRGAGPGPSNFDDIQAGDAAAYARCFHQMLARGVMMAPSAYEVGFLSGAHTAEDVDGLVAALDGALAAA